MKAPTIDEYIEQKARALTPGDRRQLTALLPRCREKSAQVPADRHPRLAAQITLLADLLDHAPADEKTWAAGQPWPELAVGAFYILKGVDCIPDSVMDIGFTDDARLLDRIFERNRGAILRAAERREVSVPVESTLP